MTAPTAFFFGDSLTDNGNLLSFGEGLLDEALLESLSGPTGAISDGPTYAAYASALLGWTEANFAVASAEAIGSRTLEELVIESGLESALLVPIDDPALDLDINLGAQGHRFQADTDGQDLSRDVAVLMIGGNDFQALDLSSPTIVTDALALLDAVLAATEAAAADLVADGMGTVWLADLPAVEFFASASGLTEAELALSQLAYGVHQDGIEDIVTTYRSAGADVRYLEMSGISAAIAENPTGFGFYAPYDQTMEDSAVLDGFDADRWRSTIPSTPRPRPTASSVPSPRPCWRGGRPSSATRPARTWRQTAAWPSVAAETDSLAGDGAVLFGGIGSDSLTGGRAADLLSGGSGDDQVLGFAGADILAGGTGDDLIAGMGRDDVLFDSLGSDSLLGGKGDDIMIFTEASLLGGSANGTNTFVGGTGHDLLYLVLGEDVADWVADTLGTNSQRSALADIGVRVGASVEEVIVLEGREALSGFAGETWYQNADAWGLI